MRTALRRDRGDPPGLTDPREADAAPRECGMLRESVEGGDSIVGEKRDVPLADALVALVRAPRPTGATLVVDERCHAGAREAPTEFDVARLPPRAVDEDHRRADRPLLGEHDRPGEGDAVTREGHVLGARLRAERCGGHDERARDGDADGRHGNSGRGERPRNDTRPRHRRGTTVMRRAASRRTAAGLRDRTHDCRDR